MALYEHVFMSRQDVSTSQVEALTEQFKSLLEENGGSVGKIEQWGVRTLQFRIRKNRKAHYTLMNIDAPPAAVKEMERQMLINDDIIRFLTLRVEQHETEPSAIMRAGRGRDDRGPRRPRDGDRGDRGGDRSDRGDRGGDRGPRPERAQENAPESTTKRADDSDGESKEA